MLIKGIRSFDPENKNVITFFRPLTLIVGPNGAGKTTIIECLKLSCTGELPPNARSGHSFIHDPKVSGETETKGQIKLRFKTAAGKDVVCIRSFQLTQKASKMEYKAIESVLQTLNPHSGEKVCLSYRCADMDREIPALMGVSKAILENVIFVHQDDANWPLQDPSTLKKKFDDIFSATRYTKALEVIKKLHKDQAQEIKTYKLKLENLYTLKDQAYQFRERIAQNQKKTESLSSEMQVLEGSIENVDAKIHHTQTTVNDLKKLKEQISTKNTIRSTLFEEQEAKYRALDEEVEDTDEELLEWQASFDQKIAYLEDKNTKQNREKKDIETKKTSATQTIVDYTHQINKLQSEADLHMSRRNERDSVIQDLFLKHNLGSLPNIPFSNEVALNLTDRIKSRLMDLEKDLEHKKESNKIALDTASSLCVAAADRWNEINTKRQANVQIKKNNLNRIQEKEKERDLCELKLSDMDLSDIDERERKLQIDVERKTRQHDERDFNSNLNQKKSEIFSTDLKITALDREKDMLADDSLNRVKLSLKKTALENFRKSQRKIIEENEDRIRGVLKGRFPPEKDLKQEIMHSLRVLEIEFDDLNSKSREAEKEVNMLKMQIQEVNNNLSKLHKDMGSKKRIVESKLQSLNQQPFSIDSYPKVLDLAKEKRDVQKSKHNIADGMRQMFDPFERVARAHHICPCCERPFSAGEEDDFVKKQRVKSASSADHLKLLAAESLNADSNFLQLDRLRMVYEEYVKIGKESIPIANQKLNELTVELDQKSQALDDVLGVLAQIKADKDSVEALVKPLEIADGLFYDIQTCRKEIDDLEDELGLRGQGGKTMEEIQLELNTLRSTKDSLTKDLHKLLEDQHYISEDIQRTQARWNRAREEKTNAATLLHDLKKVEEELDRLVEENRLRDLEEKHLEEELGPLSKEKENLQREYSSLKEKLDSESAEHAAQIIEYRLAVNSLLSIISKIKEYSDSKKGERLEELREKKALLESELQNYHTSDQKISAELEKNKDLIRNQGQLKRNIDDNLNFRKTKAQVDELTQEIELLEDRMLKMGGMERFEAELRKLMQERERFLNELSTCKGSIAVYQKNINMDKAGLKDAKFNDIDKRYYDQLIQLKTTEMANKDLDRYYHALDKALMRFHSMKMEEINKIIRELWQQTYRGQDIDFISIISDSEGAGTRSYSYRVVMRTGDAELDMRGRCSAGQKVLASIIIRLALAETFCLNCGILALDEPTTNLDVPNAESLAAALGRIMEDRKGQENFQLIVITHDERFAQLIGQRQHAEKYYRVAKDDRQHSIIEAQEIFD